MRGGCALPRSARCRLMWGEDGLVRHGHAAVWLLLWLLSLLLLPVPALLDVWSVCSCRPWAVACSAEGAVGAFVAEE